MMSAFLNWVGHVSLLALAMLGGCAITKPGFLEKENDQSTEFNYPISRNGISFWLSNWTAPPYGVYPPTTEPVFEIIDFKYSPVIVIHEGDTIILKATADRVDPTGFINVHIGNQYNPVATRQDGFVELMLSDKGNVPDEIAGDGIYSGALSWSYGPHTNLPVMARKWWGERGQSDIVWFAHPLTILSPEEE